jgi:hypothetical protein
MLNYTLKHEYPHSLEQVAENDWMPITETDADYLLNCLPPARWKGNAFAVGEPLCHLYDTGEVCYTMVCKVDEQSYFKPYPITLFSPIRFTNEIKEQLAKQLAYRERTADVLNYDNPFNVESPSPEIPLDQLTFKFWPRSK